MLPEFFFFVFFPTMVWWSYHWLVSNVFGHIFKLMQCEGKKQFNPTFMKATPSFLILWRLPPFPFPFTPKLLQILIECWERAHMLRGNPFSPLIHTITFKSERERERGRWSLSNKRDKSNRQPALSMTVYDAKQTQACMGCAMLKILGYQNNKFICIYKIIHVS